ncbi:MAG: TlpA family protein disulfide reductase [Myxococcaceae bacterium]|nr:TlpA family protein disulfide reductase [Myxococcaceae bacterium]
MLTGKKAPPFKIKRLDTGEVVDSSAYAGQPMVLNFWSTWCGPCKQEHPVLNWAAQKYQGRAVFFGIVFESEEDATKRWLQEHGEGFPQLFDPKSTVAVDYGVSGVPETYFIDKSGTIVSKYPYPIDPRTMEARLAEIL